MAEVAVGVLSHSAQPLPPHTHFFFTLSVFSGFLELGLSALSLLMPITPFSDGCLGSNVDEGRSEVR